MKLLRMPSTTLEGSHSLGKIDVKGVELFWNDSVHESDDYFGTIEYLSENFDGEAINWSCVVHFHCMQISLVMSMQFILGDD